MISEHDSSHNGVEEDLATTQTDLTLNAPSMFDLILKFLKTPGQVLLVQGPPGSGETTFALSILNSLVETHKIYASRKFVFERF